MSDPKTLLEMSGADLTPPSLGDSALVLIDMQNEYLEGPLTVPSATDAIARTAKLLKAARAAGTPIIHIAHAGRPGSLFDRAAPRGQIVDALTPEGGEPVVEKSLPNAFAGTALAEMLAAKGLKNLILTGFMTHMCVSSTARAALDLGYRVTIDGDCCGTRPLPDGQGGVVDADTLHRVALTELSDRFAVIVYGHDWS